MITENIEDIKKYARVSSSFKYEHLLPELADVADNEIAKLISDEEYAALDDYTDADAIVLKAIEHIKNAEVNFAMFNYLHTASFQVTAGGISTVVPKDQTEAKPADKRDALRIHKKKAHKALDNLLELFEKNEAKFPAWKASEKYTNFKNLLINNTEKFQEHYSIFNSRQTFLQLVPELKIVEQQYIAPGITEASLLKLKTETTTNAIFKKVKNLVSKATVLYTVSKNLGSGLFYQSANGFELRFDILDYERNFADTKEINNHIRKQRKEKANEAKEFLKLALKDMEANPELFDYEVTVKTSINPFINGKGVVAI